jgi:capsular exopolysaccharide synthesis family protein
MGKQTQKQGRYIIKDREQSAVAEAFRAIRASINAAAVEGELKTILFVSGSSGEGGAMTAVNTAAALAYSGKRVVLVDCDLRRPVLDKVFAINNVGVANIIAEGKSPEALLQDSGIDGLQVLTAGPAIKNPVDFLANESMPDIFDYLKTIADHVIITSSPLLVGTNSVLSDACILAAKVDGVLVVVDRGSVRARSAKKFVDLLTGTKARIIGAVLNGVTDDSEFVYNAAAK